MSDDGDAVDRLLAEQIRYYDDRASEYEDLWFRRGRYEMDAAFNERWFRETAIVQDAADAFDSRGDVLELACGSGLWTRRLAPRARRLVAVDSSPAMLERNRARFGRPHVTHVEADVFTWEPASGSIRRSSASSSRTSLWSGWRRSAGRLADWLRPGGAVFLVDDAVGPDRPYKGEAVEGGPAFATAAVYRATGSTRS